MPRRATQRDLAVAAARAAAAVIVESRRTPETLTAETKGLGDYVTEVDRRAETAAIAVLRGGAPDIGVLAEESGGAAADRYWVIDPVDGTTNLLRSYPEVGVSVALMEYGEPVAGSVLASYTGDGWSAAAGEGARDLSGRAIHVRAPAAMGRVVATGFPFRRKAENLAGYLRVMNAALEHFEDLRRAGAASLDLAYAAAGTWDGFFELGLSLWDIAAGALLVREAGGVVTDWAGDDVGVFRSGDILAGSPEWHAEMLALVERAGGAA